MTEYRDNRFYTVQRMQLRMYGAEEKTGLDKLFSFEYMGSAEFEYGALPAALKQIREHELVCQARELTVEDTTRPVYFLAAKEDFDAKWDDFVAWAGGRRPFRAKELTYFDDVFLDRNLDYVTTVAWWSIDCDAAWTLDPELAAQMLKAFQGERSNGKKAKKGKRR